MKSRILTALGALACLLLFVGSSCADRPTVKEEKGKPGSGIKKIVHVYREEGGKDIETKREIVYSQPSSRTITKTIKVRVK